MGRKDHLYSCTYVYPRGKIVLYGEGALERRRDHDRVLRQRAEASTARSQELKGLGQGAWVLKNGDVVVRKDYKVLLVDVRGIPPPFGPAR